VPESISERPTVLRPSAARARPDATHPYVPGDGSAPATDVVIEALARARLSRTTSGAVLGAYQLLQRLARGGMSNVYLAERATDGPRVAVKVLHPTLARAAQHRGVVSMFDDGVTPEGVPFIAMELLDGECLADRVERSPLPIGAVAAIGAQLADALAAVHTAGFVHCDLKPDNVFVVRRGGLAGWPGAKLLDFGVARCAGRADDGAPTIAGTPPYMAPEQWRAEPVLDGRTDAYGLGCLVYEMLTGKTPFTGSSLAEQSLAHQEAMPVPPSQRRAGIPVALDRLVMRCLSKDPSLRPTMASIAGTLTDLAYALPPGARDQGADAEPLLRAS
jgi:serine/threonine protein kinase